MQLSNTLISIITNVTNTARQFGIDSFAITNNMLSGIDDEHTVLIFDNNIELTGDESELTIGLNRLDSFKNRLELITKSEGYTIDAIYDTRGNNTISHVHMMSDDVAIDYRCANMSTLNFPKQMNDIMTYWFTLSPDVIDNVMASFNAMRGDKLLILCRDGKLSFELTDETRDKCVIKTNIKVKSSDDNINFAFKYPMRKLALILKKGDENTIQIGQKGMLHTVINNLPIYLLSQV